MRVVVAGSSGFLGTVLRRRLAEDGHDVVRLVRRPVQADDESQWDPYAGDLDQGLVDGADAVVNVAGSPLFGNVHSRRWAEQALQSRVTTTRVLADAVARAHRAGTTPVLVAQNATGWYGDHGDELLDESADSRGAAFMTRVCREWQQATLPAAEAGARVCVLRTAPVMDRRILPFKAMAPLFRLGLGARVGSGRQWFPVITARDWADAVVHLLAVDTEGPVNLCCPDTPTHRGFTDAVARAVGRRARLVVPPLATKAAGPLEPEIRSSFRTEPAALLRSGFTFADENADAVAHTALRA